MPVLARLCGFEGPRARRHVGLDKFPVALAWGKHLFPFRTEQLSPTAPMVLGLHGPGRVGRRRFFTNEPSTGRLVVVNGSRTARVVGAAVPRGPAYQRSPVSALYADLRRKGTADARCLSWPARPWARRARPAARPRGRGPCRVARAQPGRRARVAEHCRW